MILIIKTSLKICCILICFVSSFETIAQNDTTQNKTNTKKVSVELSADLVSSYYWRGAYNDANPNIQPSLLIGFRQFELEIWGSNNLDNSYREFDWTLSYKIKSFKFSLSDYYYDFSKRYFYYSIDSPHLLDASLKYEIGEKNTFSLLASCMVWGDDKFKFYNQSDREIQNYSTYLEASYAINCDENAYTFLLGATTHKGMYSDSYNVVNIGFKYEKSVNITPKHEVVPFFGLWVNPATAQLFFNCGLSL
jgi:hypothetical protein